MAIRKANNGYSGANHKGKKRQIVDADTFEAAYNRFTNGDISIKDAAAMLGLGEFTARRRFKEREAAGESYNPNAIPA